MRKRRVRSPNWVGSFLAGCVQSAITMFIGDILVQIFFEKVPLKDVDWRRGFQNMGVGFVFGGLVSQITNSLICSLTNAKITTCRKNTYS